MAQRTRRRKAKSASSRKATTRARPKGRAARCKAPKPGDNHEKARRFDRAERDRLVTRADSGPATQLPRSRARHDRHPAFLDDRFHLEQLSFVRREPQYRYDPERRKKVRTTDKYYILMEDPIAPEDQGAALIKAVERMINGDPNYPPNRLLPPMSEKRTQVPPPTSENRTQVPPMSEKRPYEAARKTDRKKYSEGVLQYVNVNALQKTSEGNDEDRRTEFRAQALALDILDVCKDSHSMGSYMQIARTYPEQLVREAISLTKYQAARGRIRKSRGAYFTDTVARLARE